ncbi:MAG TPA: hypothetical protein VGR06_00740 [Actinophytocola sp.]|jgi:hypothetical protein|uniref:hypothetical protein n=1 Tax=Actinophytocola sp. TaxID=1872138 RepID=UPI002E00F42F|nr:hypothetical protein [Actinophytocola sp.]
MAVAHRKDVKMMALCENGPKAQGTEGHTVSSADEVPVRPATADRITVALITEAAEAMSKVQARTGLKKVDIVNRALAIYEFIDAELRAGNQVLLRSPEGREQLVKIF